MKILSEVTGELPSVQPGLAQYLPNACTDTISRQAAIDALDEICDRGRETHEGRTDRC